MYVGIMTRSPLDYDWLSYHTQHTQERWIDRKGDIIVQDGRTERESAASVIAEEWLSAHQHTYLN